jgi:hypothetical protein
MAANTTLLLANPDFNSIEGSLQTFLQAYPQFQDYNFEGSNLSTLVNLLAYNTYQSAFLASMVASEMFLDTAQLFTSVVSHAKELGYTPRSALSACAVLNIQIVPSDNPGSIIMPAGTLFNTLVGSRSYTFSTAVPYVFVPVAGQYQLTGVQVYEGFSVTETYTVDPTNPSQIFELSNPTADTTSLVVTVNGVEYQQAASVLDLTSDDQVYFLQLDTNGLYEIIFGADIVGAQPIAQSVITATYRVTVGSDANGATTFRPSGPIAGYTNITVVTTNSASGGTPQEGIESVRLNAPLLYQTMNRAVTISDYKVLLQQQFPEIVSINAYGGEDVNPPQYGRVFICPYVEDSLGVTDVQQTKYYRYIKDKCPVSVDVVFTEPTFLYLKVNTTVYYDYVNYSVSDSDIQSAVMTAVNNYDSTTLSAFDVTFMYSQFLNTLDNADPSILSNDTNVSMVLPLTTGSFNTTQTVNYFNAIAQSSLTPAVTSSTFVYNSKTCMLQDDGKGTLNIVTNVQNASPTVLNSIGSVDYINGIVTVSPITIQQVIGPSVRVYAIPASRNIEAVQNTILNVDTTEIVITPVATKP